jgi:hypothetical protein
MEIKNMQYWKRKATLPGLNYDMDNKLPDGRSKSSALQKNKMSGSADAGSSDKNLKSQKVTHSTGKPKLPKGKARSGDTVFVGDAEGLSKKETDFIKKITKGKTN